MKAAFQATFMLVGHRAAMRTRGLMIVVGLTGCGGNDAGTIGAADTTSTSGLETTTESSTSSESTSIESGSEESTTGTSTSGVDESSSSSEDGGTTGGPVEVPTCEELPAFITAFKASHGGNGGMDWDINQMTPEEVAADPEAQALFELCGTDQRPVIPQLAWEYGGADHQWIAPEESALFYCVYTPANPATEHWSFDEKAQLVTADVTIGCHDQNPCNDLEGADQVLDCIGDLSNLEIIVDTASYDDGIAVGLELSEAATDLYLILEDESRVFLFNVP